MLRKWVKTKILKSPFGGLRSIRLSHIQREVLKRLTVFVGIAVLVFLASNCGIVKLFVNNWEVTDAYARVMIRNDGQTPITPDNNVKIDFVLQERTYFVISPEEPDYPKENVSISINLTSFSVKVKYLSPKSTIYIKKVRIIPIWPDPYVYESKNIFIEPIFNNSENITTKLTIRNIIEIKSKFSGFGLPAFTFYTGIYQSDSKRKIFVRDYVVTAFKK